MQADFSIIMKRILILAGWLCIYSMSSAQDESLDKAGLLMDRCSTSPSAEVIVLRDEAEWTVSSDMSLHMERKLVLKFFKERKMDPTLSDIVFYPSPILDHYGKITANVADLDATTKTPVLWDVSGRITSTHLEHTSIKVKAGGLLKISYSLRYEYNDKLPDWRFQQMYPTEYSSIRLTIPEQINMRENLESAYKTDVQTAEDQTTTLRSESKNRNQKSYVHYYQMSQLPAMMPEPFADNSPKQLARLHISVLSVNKDNKEIKGFVDAQEDEIVESLSTRPDFALRLSPPMEIKSQYDHQLKSLNSPMERLARIYDLVRRHIKWNGQDTLSAHYPLARVWDTKTGNSTEINLALIKLLKVYGFEVQPLITSVRRHGRAETDGLALSDFDRTVACVRLNGRNIILDATGQYCEYPLLPADILNMRGLLISMDSGRIVNLVDTEHVFKNTITLLGHLSSDTGIHTNGYIYSSGYAKSENVGILQRDSLRGLKRYLEHYYATPRMRHFIAANEYIDSMPLAQEFDIKMPVTKKDNLISATVGVMSIPDTLFSIRDDRHAEVNFGYRQEYSLVSEFSYMSNYEIYLLPGNVHLEILNGAVKFNREYHGTGTNFTLRQSLIINRSHFNLDESRDLAKFLKKVNNLNGQQVIFKKNN